jgi:hypothetical protein
MAGKLLYSIRTPAQAAGHVGHGVVFERLDDGRIRQTFPGGEMIYSQEQWDELVRSTELHDATKVIVT